MVQHSACCVWDFTVFTETSYVQVRSLLKLHCKKWCFQEESCPTSGRAHFQGRISLGLKRRLSGLKKLFLETPLDLAHWSVTSCENRDNNFYVTKDDTRIGGPYADTDDDVYIPRQIRELPGLLPWQQSVVDISKCWDTRTVYCIHDPEGNIGKSTLCTYMRVHRLGFVIPFANDFRDIMRMVMDAPIKTCFLIDMPKAIRKEKLYQMWSAIEEIKNGRAYDDRYKYRECIFDSPQVFVFTNTLPDPTMLSQDRWKICHIRDRMFFGAAL